MRTFLHRASPVAGLAVGLTITVAWIGFLGIRAYKVILEWMAASNCESARQRPREFVLANH